MDLNQLLSLSPAALYLVGLLYIAKEHRRFVEGTILELKTRVKNLEDLLNGEEREERTNARIMVAACNRVLRRLEARFGFEPTQEIEPVKPEESEKSHHKAKLKQEDPSTDSYRVKTPIDQHATTLKMNKRA